MGKVEVGFWRWIGRGIASVPSSLVKWFNGLSHSDRALVAFVATLFSIGFSPIAGVFGGEWAILVYDLIAVMGGILLILHELYLGEVEEAEARWEK